MQAKLLRVFRLGRIKARLQERYQMKHATVMIVQFIFVIFIVAHWLGCLFYFTAKAQGNEHTWATVYLSDTPDGALEVS